MTRGEKRKKGDVAACTIHYIRPIIDIFQISFSFIYWSPIGDFCHNFGHQNFFSLAMVTKMVAASSATLLLAYLIRFLIISFFIT